MRDHHAMRCSGRLISLLELMKYGTIKWVERYMSEVVVGAVVVSVDGGGWLFFFILVVVEFEHYWI